MTGLHLVEAVQVKSDVNEDGEVDSLDISVLKRYLLRKTSLSEQGLYNADTDGDGEVNSLDLSILKDIY